METVLERVKRGGALFSRIAVIGCGKSSIYLLNSFRKLKSKHAAKNLIRVFDKNRSVNSVGNQFLYGVMKEQHLDLESISGYDGYKQYKEIVQINPEEQCFHDQNDMGLHRYESLILGTALEYNKFIDEIHPYYSPNIDRYKTEISSICCISSEIDQIIELRKFYLTLFDNLKKNPQTVKEYVFVFCHASKFGFQESIDLIEACISLFNFINLSCSEFKSKFRCIYICSEPLLCENKQLTEVVSSLESKSEFLSLEFLFDHKLKKINKNSIEFENNSKLHYDTLMINPSNDKMISEYSGVDNLFENTGLIKGYDNLFCLGNTISGLKCNYDVVKKKISETVAHNVCNYFEEKEYVTYDVDKILEMNPIKFKIGNEKEIQFSTDKAEIIKEKVGFLNRMIKTLF